MRAVVLHVGILVGASWALGACSDPVRDSEISALGGEQPGIPKGPLHRAGQPCVLCHDGSGPGQSVFSLAGTVYQAPGSPLPLDGALVRFIDSNGTKHETATNCVGNFFVMQSDYDPVFPVWVKLQYGRVGPTPVTVQMSSPIYREGSCAHCHADKPATESAGHVYFAPAPFEPAGCGP